MFRRLFARRSTVVDVDLDPESAHALQRIMDLASDQFAVAEDNAKTLAQIDDKLGQLLDLMRRQEALR